MIKKIFALCLALMLLCSAALADMLAADTVVVTVGERQFTARDIDTRAYLLYSQSQAEKYPDYDAAVESLIQIVWPPGTPRRPSIPSPCSSIPL